MASEQSEDIVLVPEGQSDEIEHLEDIKNELVEIKDNTADTTKWFYRGILQGAGAILGSIVMLVIIGWILSFLGYVPGFGEMAQSLKAYTERIPLY